MGAAIRPSPAPRAACFLVVGRAGALRARSGWPAKKPLHSGTLRGQIVEDAVPVADRFDIWPDVRSDIWPDIRPDIGTGPA
ncbi:MAG: hypothetical protein AAGL96_04500 [Pseudomonadota bacterium]